MTSLLVDDDKKQKDWEQFRTFPFFTKRPRHERELLAVGYMNGYEDARRRARDVVKHGLSGLKDLLECIDD